MDMGQRGLNGKHGLILIAWGAVFSFVDPDVVYVGWQNANFRMAIQDLDAAAPGWTKQMKVKDGGGE